MSGICGDPGCGIPLPTSRSPPCQGNDANELFARKPILAPATPSQDFAPWDSQNSAPIESVKELQVEHRLRAYWRYFELSRPNKQILRAIGINLASVASLSPMIVGRLPCESERFRPEMSEIASPFARSRSASRSNRQKRPRRRSFAFSWVPSWSTRLGDSHFGWTNSWGASQSRKTARTSPPPISEHSPLNAQSVGSRRSVLPFQTASYNFFGKL